MATSGAMSTSNKYIKYKITVTQNSQNIENNTSNVSVVVNFYRTNTGYESYGSGTVYCRINGTLYSAAVTSSQKITSSGINLFTKNNLNVGHNADGTKTLSVSAWISHAVVTSSEQSYNQVLTTIPRASQPSCITYPEHTQNVGEFGDTISIHMNRKSSAFTHTVRYQFGSQSGTIATNVGTGTTWTIPLDFMNLIPNSTSGSGTIYVDTFNGSTKIGTKSCGFTANVPASVKPTCTLQVLDATDYKDTYGNLVRGLSKLYIKVNGYQSYNSPIDNYSVIVTYPDYRQSYLYNKAEFTTDVLPYSGAVDISATVTDDRGRASATAAADFPVLDYNKPKVSAIAVHRCDESGAEDENGEYIKVTFSAEITPLNNQNSAKYTLHYTNNTTGSSTNVVLSDLNGDYTVSNYSKVFAADGNSSFTVEIIAEDDIDEKSASATASTAFTLYNCHDSGTGWSFGKVAEKRNTLENALSLNQLGNTYAYQPSAFNGAKGYTLLAMVTLTALNVNAPITFVINRRGALCPMTVYARFASSSSTTDPALGSITYDGDNYGAFMVKSGVSQWKLYVDNTSGWSNPCLQSWYTTENQKARLSVSFPSEQITELPEPFYRATPAKMQSILDFIYPVNSIYISYSHDDPATLFGGTWERIENAFLWGCDAAGGIGTTGGEKTHKLTISELPPHRHKTKLYEFSNTSPQIASSATANHGAVSWWTNGTSAYKSNFCADEGGGTAHNNMPPYIQVSIWRRTA